MYLILHFCSYVLSEVHDMKNYEPRVNVTIQGDDKSDNALRARKAPAARGRPLRGHSSINVIYFLIFTELIP